MSYQGGLDYRPVETVDEVADYTDMMGGASMMNQASAQRPSWRTNPTHALIAFWIFIILTYWLTGFFFRRFLV